MALANSLSKIDTGKLGWWKRHEQEHIGQELVRHASHPPATAFFATELFHRDEDYIQASVML